jgi:hypothetical protein
MFVYIFLMSNEASFILGPYGICCNSSISWEEFWKLNVFGRGVSCVIMSETSFAIL